MKAPSSSSRSAFTLVELLVVIGIIVILMSLLLGAIPAVKEAARKTEARNMVQQICVAANAYYTEYAKFPPVQKPEQGQNANNTEDDTVVGDPEFNAPQPNNTLFFTLRNIPKGPNANYILNPRRVVFFEAKGAIVNASNKPRGGFFDKTSQGANPPEDQDGCLFDPWGLQYGVILDTTGDERIDLKGYYTDFQDANESGGRAPRKRVGAFAVGKDGRIGKDGNQTYRNGSDVSDDVVSWE